MTRILYGCITFAFFLCFSCKSFQRSTQIAAKSELLGENPVQAALLLPRIKQSPLRLTFAGDIMAHTVNYRMKDYSLIYEDIVPLLSSQDLSFANLETPVCNSLPYQTFPNFNVHTEYVQAAVNAGFNVFSLANNHTNDQGEKGIENTVDCFKQLRKQNVYSAGIKTGSTTVSYDLIDVQGWKVLFAAVTEIVNTSDESTSLFDFYPNSQRGKITLKKILADLKKEHNCDVFILSIHSNDPEYCLKVTERRRSYFYELLDAGVDIIWANHAHVTKPWEHIRDTDGTTIKFIMYGIGNTISGQNIPYNFKNPEDPHEYTGTSMILNMELKETVHRDRTSQNFTISNVSRNIIITHVDENGNFVIKQLTEDFIGRQKKKMATYYAERLRLMQQIGEIVWP